MADGAALRVDELLPREPLRQWVLRVPFAGHAIPPLVP